MEKMEKKLKKKNFDILNDKIITMKKDIQLCGLGNALVDLQFEVSDQEIARLGIAKGTMTLTDWSSQNEILKKLSGVNHNKCSGGSAANTVIAFSKFGGKAAYTTNLGNDDFGHFYANEFKELGIVLQTEHLEEHPTGICLVLISPDAERTMMTYLGASASISSDHINRDIIARSEWLYIEGYEFSSENGTEASFKAMEYALENKTKIAITFSDHFITESAREDLLKVAEKSDLIFCNDVEAMSFTKKENVDEAFKHLCERYKNIVVTKGIKGSVINWNSEVFEIPSFKTNAIDTTGAGDMYAAGFLYGIISSGSPEKAGLIASYAASRVVSQYGARLNKNHKEIAEKFLT